MPDQKTVKIPAQGAELESWLGLADISDLVPQGWSLAGGSMMRLLACERGYEGSRATRDIDVVLNIRARRRCSSAQSRSPERPLAKVAPR